LVSRHFVARDTKLHGRVLEAIYTTLNSIRCMTTNNGRLLNLCEQFADEIRVAQF
jgi:hypothetical protein